jgi:GNAT superfamily N-acetyltransferase
MTDREVRQARLEDRDAVAAFTEDTWSERGVGDYISDVFETWVETDGSGQHTAVVEVDGSVVGVCQASLLTDDEAWLQGMRVHPEYRGSDHGRALVESLLSWCHEHGGTVARNMVFGWNPAGMGQSRAVGFEPVTACRWARPDPGADGPTPDEEFETSTNVAAAWRYWTHSDARTALGGLALDTDEAWALAELSRDRLWTIGAAGRVFTVATDRTRGMAARMGTREQERETVVDYAVGAWADTDAAVALFDAIRADTAEVGADATRVCIPDTPRFVSDAAVARANPSDDAVFVFAADLTRWS